MKDLGTYSRRERVNGFRMKGNGKNGKGKTSSRAEKLSLPRRRRLGFGGAVGAGIRSAIVHIALGIVQDCVAASHARGIFLFNLESVPHSRKSFPDVRLHPRFNNDVASAICMHSETGVLECLLEIHSIIGDI